MRKLILSLTLAGVGLAVVALAPLTLKGQPKAGPTKALSHAIHAVEDLDTTLAFYRNVFGLNGMPQDFANPAVP